MWIGHESTKARSRSLRSDGARGFQPSEPAITTSNRRAPERAEKIGTKARRRETGNGILFVLSCFRGLQAYRYPVSPQMLFEGAYARLGEVKDRRGEGGVRAARGEHVDEVVEGPRPARRNDGNGHG